MQTLVLATQNAKKARELHELAGGRYGVRHLKDVGLAELQVDEPGATFAENARIKAEAVLAALPEGVRRETFAVVADDSGIVVDALRDLSGGGRPGVRSARFAVDAGVGAGDAANNALLLLMLAAVPEPMRKARFASAVCAVLVDAPARVIEAYGTVEGTIARDLRGDGGFGYDPLFCPDETPGKRMAELTADEKHAISHRGRAMRALLAKLDALPATATTQVAQAQAAPPSAPSVFARARVR